MTRVWFSFLGASMSEEYFMDRSIPVCEAFLYEGSYPKSGVIVERQWESCSNCWDTWFKNPSHCRNYCSIMTSDNIVEKQWSRMKSAIINYVMWSKEPSFLILFTNRCTAWVLSWHAADWWSERAINTVTKTPSISTLPQLHSVLPLARKQLALSLHQ